VPSVSEPASVREAAEALSAAAAQSARVSIDRPGGDVVVTTKRLDRVLEHETGDLICTVEAGVRLSALRRRLARHGQMLALDPPGDPTVGACIAANLFGPRRHRYGRIRDLLLGVTVVLSDGTIASSGGKVVKNVAGYDLGKLFCGSKGRLGLVVRASLRLHPLPEAGCTLVVPVRSPETALSKLQTILRSQLVPTAVDLLWFPAGSPARLRVGLPAEDSRSHGAGKLCVLFEGTARSVDQQLAAVRKLVGGSEGEPWDDVLAFQARCRGRRAFSGLDGPMLVRAGEAFVEEEGDSGWSSLAERVRAAFDPGGALV
jgi:glycolate dehydrogenase FAD-binding subunit